MRMATRPRRDARMPAGILTRPARRFYLVATLAYAALGLVFTAVAVAAQTNNPIVPLPGDSTKVPTGSDDASVKAYYDYLNARHLDGLSETYGFDWNTFLTIYGLILIFLVATFFFVYAWHARRAKGDMYPVEVYNGYITERGGGVDAFNWALYAVFLTYMVYYTVISVLYGQYY